MSSGEKENISFTTSLSYEKLSFLFVVSGLNPIVVYMMVIGGLYGR
jgi:hypothetical protein